MNRVQNLLLTVSWVTVASAAYVAGHASAAQYGDRWHPLGVVILAMSVALSLLTRPLRGHARNILVY